MHACGKGVGLSMNEGFSVCIPTHNNLEGLKLCLYSLKKYSKLKNEILIHVDGSKDETVEWLKENGYEFSFDEWKGACTGWNRTAERSTKDYLFICSDDMFVAPDWDVNLSKWVRKDRIIVPQLVEPHPGSYPPVYNCGKHPSEFDEGRFVTYAKKIMKHELKPHEFGGFIWHRDLFFEVEGFDEERFNPGDCSSCDLQLRIAFKHPELKFYMACDVIVYHYQRMALGKVPNIKALGTRNVRRFYEKWGFHISDAYKMMRERFRKAMAEDAL